MMRAFFMKNLYNGTRIKNKDLSVFGQLGMQNTSMGFESNLTQNMKRNQNYGFSYFYGNYE